jgi:hypothetical protein
MGLYFRRRFSLLKALHLNLNRPRHWREFGSARLPRWHLCERPAVRFSLDSWHRALYAPLRARTARPTARGGDRSTQPAGNSSSCRP